MQAHAPASPSVTNDTNATTNTKANDPFGNIDFGQMVATYLQTDIQKYINAQAAGAPAVSTNVLTLTIWTGTFNQFIKYSQR